MEERGKGCSGKQKKAGGKKRAGRQKEDDERREIRVMMRRWPVRGIKGK